MVAKKETTKGTPDVIAPAKVNSDIPNAWGVETGIVALDLVLGGYLPLGKIIELNGDSACVDKDTEFFNGYGWKKISEYEKGDKVLQYDLDLEEATLVEPENYIKLECSKITEIKSTYGINQCLTDNHVVPYLTSRGHWKKDTFDNIIGKYRTTGFKGKFKTTFNYQGRGINLSDDEIRLAVAILVVGCCPRNFDYCIFRLSKEEKIKKLKKLLVALKITYSEEFMGDYSVITVDTSIKHFPKEWYNCTKEQFRLILEESLYWGEFSAISKEHADFIQFALATQGVRASICDYLCGYGVVPTDNNLVSVSKNDTLTIETFTPDDGYCYCFTVPSGNLVLRRGNCIFVTGNCGKSTMALYLSSKLCRQGKKVYYIDIERGVTDGILQNMGLLDYKGKNFILDQETSLYSELQAVVDTQLGKDPKDRTKKPVRTAETADLIILDSLAMLMPDGSKEKTIENNVNNNMLAARYATQMFKDIVGDLAEVGTTFLFINHTQTKMRKIGFSMQQAYQDSAGSSIVKYGPDIRLYLSGTKEVKVIRKTIMGNQEARIGAVSELWTKKSRVADNGIKIPIKLIDAFGAFNGYTLKPICENLGWITGSGGNYYVSECIVPNELKKDIKKDRGYYISGKDNVEIYCQQNAGLIVEALKKAGLYHLTLDRAEHRTILDVVQKTEAKK